MFQKFSNKLSVAIEQNLPFVIFRKPNENLVHLYVNDDSGRNVFLLHSFDNQEEKSISDENPVQVDTDEFNFDFELNFSKSPDFHPISEKDYIELIQKTINQIKGSEIDKIVISRIKSIENKSYNLFQSFKQLLHTHPGALVYLWQNPGQETWLGATPELLLSQIENVLRTVSLAGTKLPEKEWTQKEYAEQKFVTDYIATNFTSVQNLKISSPETVQAGKFQHLKTYISAEIDVDFSMEELLQRLHPTPAVCGLPKQAAFEFILQNEGYKRGFYSGYIGLETKMAQEYFVNLRCAQFFQDQIWIYVGGGITAESIPENELEETELKSGTVINALN